MADKDKRVDISDALGMVETRGLVAMIEASDAMVKTANVVFVVVPSDQFTTKDRVSLLELLILPVTVATSFSLIVPVVTCTAVTVGGRSFTTTWVCEELLFECWSDSDRLTVALLDGPLGTLSRYRWVTVKTVVLNG